MPLTKNKLVPGDIVLVRWPAGWHTTIAVAKPPNTSPGVYLAHCAGPGTGTVIQEYDVVVENSIEADRHAFRRKDKAAVSTLAADYATGWSTIPTLQQAFGTAYGSFPANKDVNNASRAMGVVRAIGTNPPFEFDSLYRVFKWVSRADANKVFSQNRGTTCCAFVMACHQAAAMRNFMEMRLDLIPKILEALTKARADPKKWETDGVDLDGKTYHAGQALRENSNVGAKLEGAKKFLAAKGVEGFWIWLGANPNVGMYWDVTLATIFSSALFYDAKYVHSQNLYQYLGNDPDWAPV